ncbi:hypothetical protein N9M01_07120 [Luminiphilus sp.]|nr:hypothetical protein [Luminiphilus sp.]
MRTMINNTQEALRLAVANSIKFVCMPIVAAKAYLLSASALAQQCIQDVSASPSGQENNSCETNPVDYNQNSVSFVGDCILDLSAADPGTCDQPQSESVPGLTQPLLVAFLILFVEVAALTRFVAREDEP